MNAERQAILRTNEIQAQMREVKSGITDVCIGLAAFFSYCLLWVKW